MIWCACIWWIGSGCSRRLFSVQLYGLLTACLLSPFSVQTCRPWKVRILTSVKSSFRKCWGPHPPSPPQPTHTYRVPHYHPDLAWRWRCCYRFQKAGYRLLLESGLFQGNQRPFRTKWRQKPPHALPPPHTHSGSVRAGWDNTTDKLRQSRSTKDCERRGGEPLWSKGFGASILITHVHKHPLTDSEHRVRQKYINNNMMCFYFMFFF